MIFVLHIYGEKSENKVIQIEKFNMKGLKKDIIKCR